MIKIKFHPDAELEMLDAAVWYEGEQKGLGKRFLDHVQEAVGNLSVDPGIYQIVAGDVRRKLVKTFPYGVLFRELPGHIVVIAVMHLHREPGYWQERL